jgi:hypothetical protein
MLLNLAGKHPQNKTVKIGKRRSKLKPQGCDLVSPKNSSLGRIHASPEGLLRQWAHPRLARIQARANFVVQRPQPNRLTNRPYRMRI